MTEANMDIWLDSAKYDRETLEELRDNLMQAFNLPVSQANVLINGNSHRIKRSCTAGEADKLIKQFASWGIELRIDLNVPEKVESLTETLPENEASPEKAAIKQAQVESMFTLAPHGDTIPNLARDKTPPNVATDHLHLVAE